MNPHTERTQAKLKTFSKLPIGWKYGKGKPLSEKTLSDALKLIGYLSDSDLKTDAFMGVEGDVTLAFYQNDRDYWFHITSDGELSFGSEMQDVEVETGMSFEECRQKITLIISKWKLSSFYISKITTPSCVGSEALRFNPQATAAEFLLFAKSAFGQRPVPFADMHLNSTPRLFPILSYSTALTRPRSHVITS